MKKMKFIFSLIGLLLLHASAFSHVGSPNIVYAGSAGAYSLEVTIRPPDVVPGIAEIIIRVLHDEPVDFVGVQPIYFTTGSQGAPKPDKAELVPGEKSLYVGKLWLMAFGSSSVNIVVEGNQGKGMTVVPVRAIATSTKEMESETGWILAALGIFLFVLAVSLLGAAVGEGVTAPGAIMPKSRKRNAFITMVITALVLGAIIYGGKTWWDNEEAQYRRYLYDPLTLQASQVQEGGQNLLQISIDKNDWILRRRTYISQILPDHGKLMHVFMVSEPDLSIFFHLHPVRIDSLNFRAAIPPLPEGNYRVFADIVHSSGFEETITGKLEVKGGELQVQFASNTDDKVFSDEDDAWCVKKGTAGREHIWDDGSKISMRNTGSFKTGEVEKLTFNAMEEDGNPIQLEPYLGMPGHAVIMKKEGDVYIHLHPIGTVSMAAQQAMANKIEGDVTVCKPWGLETANPDSVINPTALPIKTMKGDANKLLANADSEITFPYEFPKAGDYRIWVQIKKKGQIHTAAFDVVVE
jgi:hypothetical protein